MINKDVIDDLYKKYKKASNKILLQPIEDMNKAIEEYHNICIRDGHLLINDIDELSPFHEIPLERILGVEEFVGAYAVVLPACIIFLSKNTTDIHVNIKMPKESIIDKIRNRLRL